MRNRKPFEAAVLLHHSLNRMCEVSILSRVGLFVILSLLLAGCGSSTTSSTTSGDGNLRPASSFAGLVDIGSGRKMYLECRGSGSPTVVLVSGLDSAADVWISYQAHPSQAVFAQVAGFTRVCAYDRPGTPVGDDLTPQQWNIVKAITGPTKDQLAQYPAMERIDFNASVAQARVAQLRRSLPVVVLSRDTRAHPMGPFIASLVAQGKLPAFVPKDFGYSNDRAWNKAQDALAKLLPDTEHLVVTGSDHNIQIDHPQAVTDAIHEVFNRARESLQADRTTAARSGTSLTESATRLIRQD